MEKVPIPTHCFVLVMVKSKNRYLLCADPKHNDTWFLPAGRLRPGESFAEAGARITMEQSGILAAMDGILKVEHSPLKDGTARLRIIFTAKPLDDRAPKTTKDRYSSEANWFVAAELDFIKPRSLEVFRLLKMVTEGKPAWPLTVLGRERNF